MGDWVLVTSGARTLPGLGKLVDGEFDPKDHALKNARVEFLRGTWWLFPGDLARVEPHEEARFGRYALARIALHREQQWRLERALERARHASFVRSPAVLDALWSFLSPEEGES